MKNSDNKIEENIRNNVIKCPECTEGAVANGDIKDDSLGIKGLSNDERSLSDAASQSMSNPDHKLFLPPFTVAKIMKSARLENRKISKKSKEFMQQCATEFILFITSAASEYSYKRRKNVLTGDDIIEALESLGFDNYVEPLTDYLEKYREMRKEENRKTCEIKELQRAETIFDKQFKIVNEYEMYRYSTIFEDLCEDATLLSDLELSID